ncbi:MAG: FAD/NAD(P)-binding protein [Candidatus Woesearchaeota archaeon]|jgi:anaerobic sulfite reductase subunit B
MANEEKIKEIIKNNCYVPTKAKILERVQESPDTFTIKIDFKCNHPVSGFVMLSIPGIGECPISICSFSNEYLKLNIREVGNMTRHLSKLQVGETVLVRGPYGKGYPLENLKGNNLIIVGGGCGVAPLKGIIEYVETKRSDFKNVHLVFGFRTPKDILFKKEMEEWKNKYDLLLTVDKNDETPKESNNKEIKQREACYTGNVGFVTNALKDKNISNENTIAFLCGPPIMIKFVIQILKEKGFHKDQIYLSAERLMNCGVGICGHCMIHGKYTCLDGPVFRYDELEGIEND